MVKQLKRILRTLSLQKILLAAIGIYMIYFSAGDMITFIKPAKDFEDVLAGDVSVGDHIDGDVLYLLDYFSTEESWTENSNGSVTPRETSAYYYIVPGSTSYLGLKVKSSDRSAAASVANETYSYLSGASQAPSATFSYSGKVIRMEDEYPKLVDSFENTLESYGYLPDEIDAMGEPLLIVPRAFGAVCGIFAVGLILFLLAAIWIFNGVSRANDRARAKAAAREARERQAQSREAQPGEAQPYEPETHSYYKR